MEINIMELTIVSCMALISWLIFTECIYDFIKCNPKQESLLVYIFYSTIGLSFISYTMLHYYKPEIADIFAYLLIISIASYILTLFSHFIFETKNKDRVVVNVLHILIPFAYLTKDIDLSAELYLVSNITTGIAIILFGIRKLQK